MDIHNEGILIVDDEQSIHLVIEAVLTEAGFKNIYKAYNGVQCINKLNEYGEKIAIILMDVNMPEMNGIDTVEHIMNHHEGVVGVIFHTAYPEFKEMTSSLGNEHVLNLDWVIKGSNFSKLISSVVCNIGLVSEKRKKLITNIEVNIIKEIHYLKDDIVSIKYNLAELNKNTPSFWADVGKQVLITIILSAFVIGFLLCDLSGLIKRSLN